MSVGAQKKILEGMLLQLDALASSIQAALAQCESEEPKPCEHPVDDRQDFSTMGRERWKCRRCGFGVDRPMENE